MSSTSRLAHEALQDAEHVAALLLHLPPVVLRKLLDILGVEERHQSGLFRVNAAALQLQLHLVVGEGHELEDLAARLDGGQDEIEVLRQQDEQVAGQRLLQGLEEGVGRGLVQALGLAQDEHAAIPLQRPPVGGGDQLVQLALAVELAVGVQHLDVGIEAAVDGQAVRAAVAGVEAALPPAAQGLGEVHGELQLVMGVGAGEDQAGRDALVAQIARQCGFDPGVADYPGQ